MYSKCHSIYLKWTYFCNRHYMGAISHRESCRQNIWLIVIVIHCTICLNVCHNELFLSNLWKCRYHVYWNLSRKVITLIKETGVRNLPNLLLTKQTFDVFILISLKWNLSSHILYFIYMQRMAIQFVEMYCTRTHISFYILISIRVTIAFYL